MKISVLLNKTSLTLLLALGLTAVGRGEYTVLIDHGASWAGGVSGNQAAIDFFNNNFSNATVTAGDYSDTANASVQAALSGADVLVLCRTTYSSDYGSADDAWYNSNLSIPIISLTSYLSRSSRLGWEGGDVIGSIIDGDETTVTAAGATVFGTSGAADWWSGSGSFDSAGTGTIGDGDILATIGGNHLVVGWNSGDLGASGNPFSGNRLLFNIPSNGNSLPDTPAGQQALIDAVAAYTPLLPGAPTSPEHSMTLTVIEAESGTLGGEFGINTLGGVSNITISPTGGGYSPGNDARVATYSITFPEADTYQLYARLYVGPGAYNDDSFFYAKTFGLQSSATDSDWNMINGLATAGFSSSQEEVTTGGAAGTEIWKWVKWDTFFTVSEGDLTQDFQIGGREDGLYLDKLVFGPSDTALTVQDLDDGTLPAPVFSTNTFSGPFGIAIHRFDEPYETLNLDGANPVGLAAFGDGLCGITFNGGMQGDGALFTMDLAGTNFNTFASLSSTATAGFPQGGVTVSGNRLYGTTRVGGIHNCGAVFSGQTNGLITVLHSFNALSQLTAANIGGADPCALLALSGGTLFGSASAGGTSGNGTLFSVSTNGTGFTVLHEFSALDPNSGTNADGAVPCDGVTLSDGMLYGTTSAGGASGAGVIFSMHTDGTGYSVLHHFDAVDPLTTTNLSGAFPVSGLVASSNVLYGATPSGGAGGAGTLFAIGIDGSGFAVLHDFPATGPAGTNTDGCAPSGRLMRSGNMLYGTASAGGSGAAGTVFALDTTDQYFETIHHFGSVTADGTNSYGAFPVSPVIRLGNALYGSAFGGGPGGAGTVFRLQIPSRAVVAAASEGRVDIDFNGAPNSVYVVQATENLVDEPVVWENVSTNIANGSGWWAFSDDTVLSNRFYRANAL